VASVDGWSGVILLNEVSYTSSINTSQVYIFRTFEESRHFLEKSVSRSCRECWETGVSTIPNWGDILARLVLVLDQDGLLAIVLPWFQETDSMAGFIRLGVRNLHRLLLMGFGQALGNHHLCWDMCLDLMHTVALERLNWPGGRDVDESLPGIPVVVVARAALITYLSHVNG